MDERQACSRGEDHLSYPKLTDNPGAVATAAAISSGAMSPSEAVQAAIARIEKLDAQINAVVVRDFERALATAKAMDGRAPGANQPLFGVPMTVKESYDVAGLPTTYGFEEYANHIARSDARVVAKLKSAGAIIIGKTNVPINLTDLQSNNPVYGCTNNPHDYSRGPGGSSGGSAAAVAAGMVPCEFGGDIGGSIRIPAHFCGVWGHKPSWGLVSRRGHQHPGLTTTAHLNALSAHGPLARNATDLATLLEITADLPLRKTNKNLGNCRLLVILDHPNCGLDASVRAPTEAAIAELEAQGIRVDTVSKLVPDLAKQHRDFIRALNISNSRGAPAPNGKQASAADWFELLDEQAANEAAWECVFAEYDFVLAPPAPILAPLHVSGELARHSILINGTEVSGPAALVWSGVATFPNLPATVVPIGGSKVGDSVLPCGIQVIGPRWDDLGCIAAARDIDQIVNG